MIPGYGTYLSWRDFVKEPNIQNLGLAALSTVGDIGTVIGVGELANLYVGGVKQASKLEKAKKEYNAAMKIYRTREAEAKTAIKQAKRAKDIERTTTLLGKYNSKYTKSAQQAAAVANDKIAQAGKAAEKINGMPARRTTITTIPVQTSGTNPGILKETYYPYGSNDLFYIGPNYSKYGTGAEGALTAAKAELPRTITMSDKLYPLFMNFIGHTPSYLNAEGIKQPEKKQEGGYLFLSQLPKWSIDIRGRGRKLPKHFNSGGRLNYLQFFK